MLWKRSCCSSSIPRGQDEIARTAVRRRFDLLQGGLSGSAWRRRGGTATRRAGRALRRRFRSRRLPRRRRHAQRDGQRHHAPAAGEASAAELPARRQHERLRGKPVHFLRSRARGAERHAPSAAATLDVGVFNEKNFVYVGVLRRVHAHGLHRAARTSRICSATSPIFSRA